MTINYMDVQRAHRDVMPPKVASIFATKSLMADRRISMKTGMPIIGSVLSVVNLGFFGAHLYTAVTDWGRIPNKVTHVSQTVAHGSLATAGLITLTIKVKPIAKVLGVHKTHAAMTAAKVGGTILAPVGLAIFSLLSLGMGVQHLVNAYQETDVVKRNDHLYEAAKNVLLSLALAIGAFVMAGLAATPFGWAALALILVVILLNTDFVKYHLISKPTPVDDLPQAVHKPLESSRS